MRKQSSLVLVVQYIAQWLGPWWFDSHFRLSLYPLLSPLPLLLIESMPRHILFCSLSDDNVTLKFFECPELSGLNVSVEASCFRTSVLLGLF